MDKHFEEIWYLQEQSDRIKLIEVHEKRILEKRKTMKMNFNSDLLYNEAKSSFIIGNFISAALTFYLSIEQYLLWKNHILRYKADYDVFKTACHIMFLVGYNED